MTRQPARVTTAVLGCLLENPDPMRQTHIAAAIGATQARVSQVLNESDRTGLTARTRHGWCITAPSAVFDLCMSRQSRRTTTYGWYSLDGGRHQVTSCLDAARRARTESRLDGDWAADRLAPWRIPRLITICIDAYLDLEPMGFVPCDLDVATLHTVISPIRSSWRADPRVTVRMAGSRTTDVDCAPVHEVARQILATGGTDAEEAVAELRRQFLTARENLTAYESAA